MANQTSDFLNKLRAANIARNKEWDSGEVKLSLTFRANELAGEVGEACNVLKKLDREFNYKIRGSRDTVEHLAEELADIVICSDLLGMTMKIDFDLHSWPQVETTPNHDYSLYGALLATQAGRVCGIAMHHHTHINNLQLMTVLRGLLTFTKVTADRLSIDIERRVANKFNETSHKMGLSVFFDTEAELVNG